MGNGQFLRQAAHLTNILLVMHGVNYRAGTQKQKGFEKSMRHYMKYCSGKCAYPQAQKHITKLTNS